jgi:hypothetical protein
MSRLDKLIAGLGGFAAVAWLGIGAVWVVRALAG